MADMFKKLKKTIDKGVATVSVKSNSLIEINKINVHMNSLVEKIANKKVELGEMVYRMYIENNPDQEAIAALCQEIIGLKEQHKEKEKEIERIKQEEVEILGTDKTEIKCSCGQIIPEEYSFCTSCGAKVAQEDSL